MAASGFTRVSRGKHVFFSLSLPKKSPRLTVCVSTRGTKNPLSLCRICGIDPKRLVGMEQVHGDGIAAVGKGKGGRTVRGCDALMTGEPDVPLLVRTADCVPIMIFDPVNLALAAVHAGWRGTAKRLAVKTLRKMRGLFDTRYKDCIITMGPSIRGCCYEVDRPVIDALKAACGRLGRAASAKGKGRWTVDLAYLNAQQLRRLGVRKSNIIMGACSSCRNDLFHSYRAEGKAAGRTFSIGVMKR